RPGTAKPSAPPDAPGPRSPPASLAIPQAEPRSLPPSQCELGTSYTLWSVSYCLHRAHAPRLSWTRSNSGRFSVTRRDNKFPPRIAKQSHYLPPHSPLRCSISSQPALYSEIGGGHSVPNPEKANPIW